MTKTISIVGLGGMGFAMAERLLEIGYTVRVYNRTSEKARPLVDKGATLATPPADAVEIGGIVLTTLSNDEVLEWAVVGEDGFWDALGKNGVHLSMSTISVDLAKALAEKHAEAGSHFVAAPVFGRPVAAAAGMMWIALSGAEEPTNRVRPVLKDLGQAVYEFGDDPAAAHLAKIAGNFMIASAIEAMGEAFALAEKNGVDPAALQAMISDSIFACPIYTNYGNFICDQAFVPPGFKMELARKDIGLGLKAAAASDTPMPLASLLADRFASAVAKGRGEIDWTGMSMNAAEDAGLTPSFLEK